MPGSSLVEVINCTKTLARECWGGLWCCRKYFGFMRRCYSEWISGAMECLEMEPFIPLRKNTDSAQPQHSVQSKPVMTQTRCGSLEGLTGVLQSKVKGSNSFQRCKKCYKHQGMSCSPCSLWVGGKKPALDSSNGEFC